MSDPPLPFTIREAQRHDRPAIRRLIRSFPEQLWQKDLPQTSSFFLAEYAGQIVGCCALQIYSRRLAEVRSLAILPAYRGRGAALGLVKACKLRAAERGIKQVLAVTSEVAFFERCGFSAFRRERTALFFDVDPTAG